jgi:hypothetical protein
VPDLNPDGCGVRYVGTMLIGAEWSTRLAAACPLYARLPDDGGVDQPFGCGLRHSNCAAGEKALVRISNVTTSAVVPDATRIIATMTNW